MSRVIANIEDDDNLNYSYQLCMEDDGTYYMWRSSGFLNGRVVFKDVEDIKDALRLMMDYVFEYEGVMA
jgi:hypothetical protein